MMQHARCVHMTLHQCACVCVVSQSIVCTPLIYAAKQSNRKLEIRFCDTPQESRGEEWVLLCVRLLVIIARNFSSLCLNNCLQSAIPYRSTSQYMLLSVSLYVCMCYFSYSNQAHYKGVPSYSSAAFAFPPSSI